MPSNQTKSTFNLETALAVPDSLLRVAVVESLTGMTRGTIYRKVKEGNFCQPIRLNSRCSRWRAGDVQAWLRAQAKGGPHV